MARIITTVLMAAGLGLGGCLTPEPIPAVPLPEMPFVAVRYYPVSGLTETDIRRSINRNRPGRYDSTTQTELRFTWAPDGEPCRVTRAQIHHQTTISLPRHTNLDSLNPDLRAHWDAFIAALEHHEKGHVVITAWQVERLTPTLAAADCDEVQATIRRVRRAVAWAHDDYDTWTDHGWIQGVAFGGPFFTAPVLARSARTSTPP